MEDNASAHTPVSHRGRPMQALISTHERGIGALRARQRFADDLVVSHCLVCVTMPRLFMYTIC